VAPDWLKEQVPPDWYERYGDRIEDTRLPQEKTEREVLSRRIGDDGFHLLACVEQAAQQGMDWLKQVPAVQTLEQIWAQQ
jgi:transposase